ncbi:MAG TPA: GNAT family N-acetyltransferase [Caulobacteraceae bacterium]|nr:GNAT family N-acetyltransferase [Caulobacteraceae bacterium]
MPLTVRPLSPALWPALEEVMPDGARGCWCMYWRIGRHYRGRSAAENRAGLRAVVEAGPPPGLIAFDGETPVGWCQVGPRADLPELARAWRLAPVDDLPVWALSCLYTRKGYRRAGVTAALIEAAVEAARRAGAPALEAYPFDRERSPSATGTGFASTFARLGFEVVARRIPARPIMRRMLNGERAV